jgi:F0F1-type ATP synthase assembly protein I
LDDKSDLLKSLKIDRSEASARAGGMPAPVALSLAAGSLVIGAALGWFLKPAPPPVEVPVVASTSS